MQRLSSLRKDHEIQMKSLTKKHEENCQKLQDELELQKSKVVTLVIFLFWKSLLENISEHFFFSGGKAKSIVTATMESNGRNPTG